MSVTTAFLMLSDAENVKHRSKQPSAGHERHDKIYNNNVMVA